VEELERRLTPAITLTNAFLVNADDTAMNAPPDKGESFYVEADWTTQGLPANAAYHVLFTVDGVTLDSGALHYGAGAAGMGSWNWYQGPWFASPGTHNVSVTVSPTTYGTTSWSFSFAPVTAPDLPHKFITPLGGTPYQTWGITNYVDVDPTSGIRDFMGGQYTYDGHTGHDLVLANFSAMDAGVPDYAAAAGTVVDVADGNFDRNTTATNVPANFVEIDNGNGWHTFYYHLRTDTILVHVGDTVVAGQVLGLAGSSGYTTAAHLHFEVQHNGNVVEPDYDPTTYWVTPLTYQGSISEILDSAVTSTHTVAETDLNAEERPVAANTFTQAAGQEFTVWLDAFTRDGDQVAYKFYQPDGSPYSSLNYSFTAGLSLGGYWDYVNTLPANLAPGTWHVGIEINGTEMARDAFQVAASGAAAARVGQGSTYVPNGRTTPIDFGTAGPGGTPPTRTFTVSNLGSATLTLSNLVLPAGYSLVGTFPGSVAVGGSATFKVQMGTGTAGTFAGTVQFTTNDPNAPTYSFNVKGVVSGGNTGEIHGQVFEDANNDGIENGSEHGRVGWTVALYDTGNNFVTATTTGYNGYYAFLNVAPGTYRVRQVPPAGWVQTTQYPADTTVGTADVLASPFGVRLSVVASLALGVPAHVTAGAPFTVTVTARDSYGYTATDYTGTVHFSSSDAGAVLPGNTTLINGFGSFSVTLKANGGQTVTAQDTVNAALTNTAGATVIAGPVLVAQLGNQGVWSYTSSAGDKMQLTPANAALLATDSGGDVAGEFSGYGVWMYRPGSGWKQLTASDASLLVLDAQGDVTGEFLHYGVWQYATGAGWKQLTVSDASLLAAGAGGAVTGEFSGYGVWMYQPASGWKQLTPSDASLLVLDIQGNVTGEFTNYGVWQDTAGGGWKQLTPSDAALLTAGAGGAVTGEFLNHGVWQYQPAGGWHQLTPSDATQLVADAYGDVFAAFPGYGVWEFDPNRGWAQVTASDGVRMAAGS
jgi:murein DD-endopeptidase MepM/ murein hydrolase activator NlpD